MTIQVTRTVHIPTIQGSDTRRAASLLAFCVYIVSWGLSTNALMFFPGHCGESSEYIAGAGADTGEQKEMQLDIFGRMSDISTIHKSLSVFPQPAWLGHAVWCVYKPSSKEERAYATAELYSKQPGSKADKVWPHLQLGLVYTSVPTTTNAKVFRSSIFWLYRRAATT